MHMLRLGFQGLEYLKTAHISLPMVGDTGDYLRSVRRGEVPMSEVLAKSEDLEKKMVKLLDGSTIPPEPLYDMVEFHLVKTHFEVWES